MHNSTYFFALCIIRNRTCLHQLDLWKRSSVNVNSCIYDEPKVLLLEPKEQLHFSLKPKEAVEAAAKADVLVEAAAKVLVEPVE